MELGEAARGDTFANAEQRPDPIGLAVSAGVRPCSPGAGPASPASPTSRLIHAPRACTGGTSVQFGMAYSRQVWYGTPERPAVVSQPPCGVNGMGMAGSVSAASSQELRAHGHVSISRPTPTRSDSPLHRKTQTSRSRLAAGASLKGHEHVLCAVAGQQAVSK